MKAEYGLVRARRRYRDLNGRGASQPASWVSPVGLGYEVNSTLIERLRTYGAVPDGSTVESHGRAAWRDYAAVRHPDDPYDQDSGSGLGRRLLFQRVPDGKTTKNRLHLDLHVGEERRDAEVARLRGLGATVLYRATEPMGEWMTMADPEGNEFCVE